MSPRAKPKSKSDTRSVPIPDDLWDTADRYGSANGGIPRAAVVRLALQELFKSAAFPIHTNQE